MHEHEHEEEVYYHDHGDGHVHSHPVEHSHEHGHVHTQTKAVINRLSRAIGHLESVKRMVEDGRDCTEVLIQLAAVRSALSSTSSPPEGIEKGLWQNSSSPLSSPISYIGKSTIQQS